MSSLLAWFAPEAAIPLRTGDPAQNQQDFKRWQWRILIVSIIGYAGYYFVRKNLSLAMPGLEKDLGISKTDLGLFLTLHGVLYGLSKFLNGMLGDRANARTFMAFGLMMSVVMNFFFGISGTVLTLGLCWMLNGWFQGMGFPPCARLMTHWMAPQELARKMSLWNSSHCIGAILTMVLCGYLAVLTPAQLSWAGGGLKAWQLCFFVPSLLAMGVVVLLLWGLRDTPEALGFPDVTGEKPTAAARQAEDSYWQILVKYVFSNPYIWLISFANFFVYVVRYAVLDWGPTLLKETKGIELNHGGWMVAGFELAGLAGMIASGWITDKVFKGRAARTCIFFMLISAVGLLLFWKIPTHSKLLATLFLGIAGFGIYGPQCLIGIMAANLATKRAAATAGGLTGFFGYLSTVASGWGLGKFVQKNGWDAGFGLLLGALAVGTVLFALAWGAKADGYEKPEK